jgi:hypothetical protein
MDQPARSSLLRAGSLEPIIGFHELLAMTAGYRSIFRAWQDAEKRSFVGKGALGGSAPCIKDGFIP